jgi:hypothetical protein
MKFSIASTGQALQRKPSAIKEVEEQVSSPSPAPPHPQNGSSGEEQSPEFSNHQPSSVKDRGRAKSRKQLWMEDLMVLKRELQDLKQ